MNAILVGQASNFLHTKVGPTLLSSNLQANLIASKHSPRIGISEESCTSQYGFQKYDHFRVPIVRYLPTFAMSLVLLFSTCFDLESWFIDPLVPFHKVSCPIIQIFPSYEQSVQSKNRCSFHRLFFKDEISRACSELLSFGAQKSLFFTVLSYQQINRMLISYK